MNKIFRSIWSDALGTFVPVAEFVSSRSRGAGKRSRLRLLAASVLLCLWICGGTAVADILPTGGHIVAGSGAIATSGNTMTVTQDTQRMAADWTSFSIGQNNTVNFNQPSSSAVALNRVTGADASVIQGALNANGQVFLVNPNGVLFSSTAQVNVGGIVASTLNITNDDFMAGNDRFAGSSSNAIVNQGNITTHDGGTIALIAARIDNSGTLTANGGNVLMGAGSKVTLDLGGPVKIQVEEAAIDALIEQGGAIKADGGLVYLTARAAGELTSTVINHTGITEAQTLATGESGQIYLMGDMVNGRIEVAGTLDASAPNGGDGGFIETSGRTLHVSDTTTIKAKEWLIDPTNITIESTGSTSDLTGSSIKASFIESTLNGGTGVTLLADNDINVNEALSWNKSLFTLTAGNDINVNAVMNATGTAALTMSTSTASGKGVKMGFNPNGSFKGRIDYSSSGAITINDHVYTRVNNITELQAMKLTGKYYLGSNISAYDTRNWNIGNHDGNPATAEAAMGFVPIGDGLKKFTGNFDGFGHTISNLFINRLNINNVGLFGYTDTGATIQNVGVSVNINGQHYVGGLVGYNNNSATITNSYTSGSVNGNRWVGGLVGYDNNSATITNSYSSGSVTGYVAVGGLVGYGYLGAITNSYTSGSITGSGDLVGGLVGHAKGVSIANSYTSASIKGSATVGGLVGYAEGGAISYSYTSGSMTGGRNVGGLVGYGYSATITNSYASGSVNGTDYVGGLVGGLLGGVATSATITNSYASGIVVAYNSYVGGLVGEVENATITNSYASGSVRGSSFVGGLVGYNKTSATITNSYATGIVEGYGTLIGGLVGYNYSSTITNSYASGSVTGRNSVGGLVGEATNSGTITNSYASGIVKATDYYPAVGGLVGKNDDGTTITNSFWDIETSGQTASAGGGVGKTTAQMQQIATYSTDITVPANRWSIEIDEEQTDSIYPYLTFNAEGPVWKIGKYVLTLNYTLPSIGADNSIVYKGSDYILNDYWTNSIFGTAGSSLVAGMDYKFIYNNADVTGFKNAGTYADVSVSTLNPNFVINIAGNNNGTFTIAKKALTISGLTSSDKIYDGLLTATVNTAGVTKTGFIVGDALTVSSVGTFADKNAGTAKTVNLTNTYAGADVDNYAITNQATTTANIAQKALTIAGLTSSDKVYDGLLTAAVNGTAALQEFEAVGAGTTSDGKAYTGDTVTLTGTTTATFNDKDVNDATTVSFTGLSITGDGANNYTLTAHPTVSNKITAKDVTLAYTAQNKTYDGTMNATVNESSGNLISGDSVTVSQLAILADKNTGTGKTVNISNIALSGDDATNYNLTSTTATTTADIAQKDLTISGLTAANKVYDATTAASLYGTAAVTALGSDSVTLEGTAAGVFANSNVGDSKTITVSGLTLTGDDAGNYTLVVPADLAANITPRHITVVAGDKSKVYGNDDPSLTWQVTDGNLVGADTLSGVLSRTAGENVGRYTIDASVLANGNYLITSNNGELTISQRPITVVSDNKNKVYGNADPTLSWQVTDGNLIGEDQLTGVLTRASGENVGTYTIDASGLANGNYLITANDGTLTITAAPNNDQEQAAITTAQQQNQPSGSGNDGGGISGGLNFVYVDGEPTGDGSSAEGAGLMNIFVVRGGVKYPEY